MGNGLDSGAGSETENVTGSGANLKLEPGTNVLRGTGTGLVSTTGAVLSRGAGTGLVSTTGMIALHGACTSLESTEEAGKIWLRGAVTSLVSMTGMDILHGTGLVSTVGSRTGLVHGFVSPVSGLLSSTGASMTLLHGTGAGLVSLKDLGKGSRRWSLCCSCVAHLCQFRNVGRLHRHPLCGFRKAGHFCQ